MNDIFFYYGFIYLIMTFRRLYLGIFPNKKTEELLTGFREVKVEVSQESLQDLKELSKQANDSDPKIFMILGFINIIWVIVGLKLGVEPFYFSVLLTLFLVTILMAILGLFTKNKQLLSPKLKLHGFVMYGIELTACSMILYNHFIK